MTRVDPRLRIWGWLTRRMVPIATMLVVYLHGGGFALGSLDMGNWLCGRVA